MVKNCDETLTLEPETPSIHTELTSVSIISNFSLLNNIIWFHLYTLLALDYHVATSKKMIIIQMSGSCGGVQIYE